jgi:SAM-dependent methyltransferase
VTPEDVLALRSPGAQPLLRLTTEAYAADVPPDTLALTQTLRADGHDPGLIALTLTQARLRRSAASRLGPRGARLLWTPEAAEQVTRAEVSAHRARRLATHAARVADLGCGAGGDALAMADVGLDVLAVERDPTTAAVAAANVEIEGYAGRIEVRCADVLDLDLGSLACDAAFVDPSRRQSGHRRFEPESWSPAFSWVARLAEHVPATVAKVAPGIPHTLLPAGAEGEWVSWKGGLKEAAIWHGPLATAARRATLLPSAATLTDVSLSGPPEVGAAGGWLIEPDDAVIRAGLVAAVAAQVDGRLLDNAIAYVVTDAEPVTPYGTTFEVLTEIPFALKRMRATLRAWGYGDVIIKKRGVAVVPDELRRRLALGGVGPTATLVLTRTSSGPLALLVRRVTPVPA